MKKPILLLIFSFILKSVAAQQTYSLDSCIHIGLQNNLDILIQKEYLKISENNATYGNAGGLPSVSADANGGMDMVSGYNTDVSNYKTSSVNVGEENVNAGINVSWTIFNGFKISSTYKKLQNLEETEVILTRMTIENTVAQIAEVYYHIIRQEIRQENLKASQDLSAERLSIAQQRFNIGDASLIEFQQAEVDYNNDHANYIKQQRVVYEYYLLLNQLLNVDSIHVPMPVASRNIDLYHLSNQEDLYGKMLQFNTSLLVASSQVALKEHELKIVKSRFYPTISFNGGYNYGGLWNELPPVANQQHLELSGSINLSINLFDGMNKRREKKNAEAAIDISKLEQSAMVQNLKVQFSNLWMNYTNNLTLIELEQKNIESAQNLLTSAMDRYRLGELSGIELREAQNKLLLSEERLSTSQLDAKLNEISLLLLSSTILEEMVRK